MCVSTYRRVYMKEIFGCRDTQHTPLQSQPPTHTLTHTPSPLHIHTQVANRFTTGKGGQFNDIMAQQAYFGQTNNVPMLYPSGQESVVNDVRIVYIYVCMYAITLPCFTSFLPYFTHSHLHTPFPSLSPHTLPSPPTPLPQKHSSPPASSNSTTRGATATAGATWLVKPMRPYRGGLARGSSLSPCGCGCVCVYVYVYVCMGWGW